MAYTGVLSEGISKAAVAPNAHGQASEEETSANSTTRDDPNIAHPAGRMAREKAKAPRAA